MTGDCGRYKFQSTLRTNKRNSRARGGGRQSEPGRGDAGEEKQIDKTGKLDDDDATVIKREAG